MAIPRDNPYGAFNFTVTAERFGGDLINAGFQEISGLGMEVTEAEYRNGNDSENHVRKMNGLCKATDVTLKRGITGRNAFFEWINAVGIGRQDARCTVTIGLMDEAHSQNPVMTWVLTAAKPKSYKGATLNAKGGTDVALEELVLSCEKLTVG